MSELCEALKHSEALRLASLFENMPSGCLVIDLAGTIVDVNPKALDILGSPSADETKQINVLAFQPLVDAGVADIARRALSGEKITNDIIYTSRWGKTSTIRFSSTPIYDGDYVCLALILMEDLTEYTALKSELEKTNKLLKIIIDSVPSMIWMKDADGRYLHANEAFREFCEFHGDIIGATDADIWPDANKYTDVDHEAMECDYPVAVTEEVDHPIFGKRWYNTTKVGVCDSEDNVIGTVGISCDITRKHERDEILAEAIETLTASLNRNIYVK